MLSLNVVIEFIRPFLSKSISVLPRYSNGLEVSTMFDLKGEGLNRRNYRIEDEEDYRFSSNNLHILGYRAYTS